MNMPDIAENLRIVRERIAVAAARAGRNPEDIILVAVSKTVDVERIRQAIAAGATDLGENYVQEAIDKCRDIGNAAKWHFIGHLQKNKAKFVVEAFDLVQSVDTLELAWQLGKRAAAAGRTIDVLIEAHISGEESKFGASPSEVIEMAGQVDSVEGVRVLGLMGMPPFLENPEDVRPYFAELKGLWERLPDRQRKYLSMGMSHDFEVAIEEGSNMVRVGTAIFGSRV